MVQRACVFVCVCVCVFEKCPRPYPGLLPPHKWPREYCCCYCCWGWRRGWCRPAGPTPACCRRTSGRVSTAAATAAAGAGAVAGAGRPALPRPAAAHKWPREYCCCCCCCWGWHRGWCRPAGPTPACCRRTSGRVSTAAAAAAGAGAVTGAGRPALPRPAAAAQVAA
ncbi:hypothetical protein ACJJTC_018610 [Scirpophaga incertulas]